MLFNILLLYSTFVFCVPFYTARGENATDYDTAGYVPPHLNPFAACFLYTEAQALLEEIFVSYDFRLRPRRSQTDGVSVQSSFVPMAIIEFDTSGQSMLVSGYFTVTWMDELLGWDNTYYMTNYVRLNLKNVWYPRLVLLKSFGHNVIGNHLMDVVTISHEGQVTWVPDGQYRFACDVDVTYYPFDKQKCSMTYYVTDQTADTVVLNVTEVSTSEYSQNAEWSLKELTSDIVTQHSTNLARVTFTIQRRTAFTVYTLVLPILTLTVINVFSFLVPIQTGEKGGLSITIFLTYAFFITLVRDALPHNSLQTSRYAVFLCSSLVLSVVSVVYTAIECKLYYAYGTDRATFVENLRKRYDKHIHLHSNIKVQVEPETPKNIKRSLNEPNNQLRTKDLRKAETGRQQPPDQPPPPHHRHGNTVTMTWAQCLTQADKIMFGVSLVYKAIFSIVVYYQIGMNYGDPE